MRYYTDDGRPYVSMSIEVHPVCSRCGHRFVRPLESVWLIKSLVNVECVCGVKDEVLFVVDVEYLIPKETA